MKESYGHLRSVCVARFRCLHGAGGGGPIPRPRCRALEFFDILHLGRLPSPRIQRSIGLWIGGGEQRKGVRGKGRFVGRSLAGPRTSRLQPPSSSLKRITLYREGLRGRQEPSEGTPVIRPPMRPRTPETVGMASPVRKVLTLKRSCSPFYGSLRRPFHRLESGVTPHKIAPKLGQVFLPHRRISCSLTFHQQQKQHSDCEGEGDGWARGLLGFVVPPHFFPVEPAQNWDYISQEAVHKGGGVEGGRGGCLTAASWEA